MNRGSFKISFCSSNQRRLTFQPIRSLNENQPEFSWFFLTIQLSFIRRLIWGFKLTLPNFSQSESEFQFENVPETTCNHLIQCTCLCNRKIGENEPPLKKWTAWYTVNPNYYFPGRSTRTGVLFIFAIFIKISIFRTEIQSVLEYTDMHIRPIFPWPIRRPEISIQVYNL